MYDNKQKKEGFDKLIKRNFKRFSSSNYKDDMDFKHKSDLENLYKMHIQRLMAYYSSDYLQNADIYKKETEIKAAWSTFSEILKLQRIIFHLDENENKENKGSLDQLIKTLKRKKYKNEMG